MNREDLNKKRDELMELFSEKTKVADQGLAFYDKRFGFEQGFNACADILLPEIDNGVIKYQNQYQYSKFFHSKAIQQTSKIQTLEQSNAELKTGLGVAGEFIKRNDTLTAQLEIAEQVLEMFKGVTLYEKTGSNNPPADEAIEKMKAVK